MLDDAPLQCG